MELIAEEEGALDTTPSDNAKIALSNVGRASKSRKLKSINAFVCHDWASSATPTH